MFKPFGFSGSVRPDEIFQFAFRYLPAEEQAVRISLLLEQHQAGLFPLEGIFVQYQRERLAGVLLSQRRPDGTLLVWPPVVEEGVSTETLYRLLDDYALKNKVRIAVMLVDAPFSIDETDLVDKGRFEYLSDLDFMVAVEPSSSETESEEIPTVQFVPMREKEGPSFQRMVELARRTYHNTLDFPKLIDIASTDDVLRGYQLDDHFRPDLWFFVQRGGFDVGVLILTDMPDEQMELTYMGLFEEERGRGTGREIVRFAKKTAFRNGRRFLLTSVDAQNVPALKTYSAEGLHSWERKKVYAKFMEMPDRS